MRRARFEVYRGWTIHDDPEWYWRLWAPNGRIVADGAEGYTSKRGAQRAVRGVIAMADWPLHRIDIVVTEPDADGKRDGSRPRRRRR